MIPLFYISNDLLIFKLFKNITNRIKDLFVKEEKEIEMEVFRKIIHYEVI